MHAQKLSISLPKQQCEFIESYQAEHHYKSRSEVIKDALYLLQQASLETHYREANHEADRVNKKKHILTLELIQSWLLPRPHDAHKGLFGHVLVIGGDHGMPGSVRLAAEGAMRVGAGLVTVATRPAHIMSTVIGCPELLCYGVESVLSELDGLLEKASVVVLGPGLGQSSWSHQLFDKVLSCSLPLLIDADGLNCLARMDSQLVKRSNWILTPHPGEAARLLGITTEQVQSNRPQAVQLLQQRYDGVIILKGANSLIASKELPVMQCTAGNPGMASAGMGDLLSGMIGGLVAQGLSPWQATQAGVMLHATAGDRVALRQGERGLLASDLLGELSALMNGR